MTQTWGVSVAKTIGSSLPSCGMCRDEENKDQLREAWGCDKPSKEVIFKTKCSRCRGDGCPPEDAGEWPDPVCHEGTRCHYRCMNAVLSTPRALDVRDFIHAYRLLDSHGVMPARGAWLDQTCQFAMAVDVAVDERSLWQKAEEEHRETTLKQKG